MKPFIDALKDQIEDMILQVQNKFPTNSIEIAFIGYTAVGDIPSDVYEPFTKNIALLQRKLRNGRVSRSLSSGCRMVVEGYASAVNLKWTASRRIIFHMGNAPSYGSKYHEKKMYDPFSHGHPYFTLEEQIKLLACNAIDVVILKLSNTTTIMEKILETNYQTLRANGFHIVNLTGQLKKLDAAVYSAVVEHLLRVSA
jgi:hypothetical protein